MNYSYIIAIICLPGLLYQTSLVLIDYLRGQTVVAIKVGKAKMETLPTISFCFENVLLYQKLAKYDSELQIVYNNYTSSLDYYSQLKNINNLDDKSKTDLKYLWSQITKRINPRKLFVKDISTNFSTPNIR